MGYFVGRDGKVLWVILWGMVVICYGLLCWVWR